MKNSPRMLILLVITLLFLSGCQEPIPVENGNQYGILNGTVVDDMSGLRFWSGDVEIAGKQIRIEGGSFQVKNIPAGTYTLKVSKEFYRDKELEVVITSNNNMIHVKMTPSFSNADLDFLARMVHAEARGEPYRGQVAVAASILNRVRHHNYPNTLVGVLTQRTNGYAQYSPIDDGSINIPASQTAKYAVRDALVGWDPSLGATGFFNPAKVTNRSNWVWQQIPIIDIGNHRFFRAVID